jgi:hypothetical protein
MKPLQVFIGVVVSSLVFVACQGSPASVGNTLELGQVELGFGNTLNNMAAFQTETGITFTPSAAAIVCDDVQSNFRYIYRRFTVSNSTGSTLTNLQLHAYNKTSNASSTALKSLVDFGGNPSPNATLAKPRHGIGASCGTAPFVSTNGYADLQVYSDAEITSRTTLAGSNLVTGEYLLGYGYLVQQRSPQTNNDFTCYLPRPVPLKNWCKPQKTNIQVQRLV